MITPKRPLNSINALIQSLKSLVDDDGFLELDREQTIYLFFFLYELLEREPDMKDTVSIRFAIEDLIGSIASEESA